jgi:aspartate/methionine/tyrosine aminotransferase
MPETQIANVPLSAECDGPTPEFIKWHPSELMEWAKSGYSAGSFNLARSGIPAITEFTGIPGGPFVPHIYGHNEWGHEGLKAAIAAMYGAQPENVLIAQGASQCNFLIAGAALSAGGTAIAETPFYQPVLRSVQVWADRILRLPRRKEDGYQPDPDELRRLLTADTRLIVLTNLHNPTQMAMDADRVHALTQISAEVGAVVSIDEVFLPMLDRNHRKHGYGSGAISICSLGKSFGLDGLRVGWAVGPSDLIHRAYRLNNLLGVNQPWMTEDLAFQILNSPAAVDYLIDGERAASRGRDLLDDFLRKTPRVSCLRPTAGISALIELPKGTDDQQFALDLNEKTGTTVFPGSYFECPGTLRVSFGGPHDETAQGFAHLSRMIGELP